jgi:diguanylate cyclase (GGDEF)-like protein/PAS domain S-box-containing protein
MTTANPDPAVGMGLWPRFIATHLFDYNPAARSHWLRMVAAGGLSVAWAAWQLALMPAGELWQVLGWALIVALAAAFPIPLPRGKMSVATTDTLNFLLLALYGPAAAVLAAVVEGSVAARMTSARLTSRLGTPACNAAGMLLAGTVFVLSEPALVGMGVPPVAAHIATLALAAGVYLVAGSLQLMRVICLKRGTDPSLRRLLADSSWVGTLYLLAAVLAGLLSINAQHFGRSVVVAVVLVLGLSLALLRAHFRQQAAEHEAQEARVRAAQDEAAQNQKRFHSAFTQASIGMAIVAADGCVHQANLALCRLLGYGDGQLPGREFSALLHPGDAVLLRRHAAGVLARKEEAFSIELRCRAADQREIWVSLHCALFEDPAQPAAGLIYQLHDITSRRRAEGELHHIAYHDSLTDLANRNCFHERLRGAVERSRVDPECRFALLVLDLDRFKIVNDSLGHPAGDELLKSVALRLSSCVRPQDLVARLGGDEFAILIEQAPQSIEVARLGQRLQQALEQPLRINGTELCASASIGVTFSDMGYREPDEMLRDADLAMYRAKAEGKGRLVMFDTSMHDQQGQKLQLEADLRRAIGEGQLSLAFQPLFTLEPYALSGFEALARWVHPARGAISPGVFIALAEETGCIDALTAWAIDEAVRQMAEWRHAHPALAHQVMHVNVSGKDLARPHFVPHVGDVLQRHGLPPANLVLEITESTLMEHREMALKSLDALCEMGVKLGIDDFGTGYSSLAYLSTLPFDCLKIDRSFVTGMDKSAKNLEIVRTVLSLGLSLGKQVVAEGIETHDQLRRLRAMGASIGQGYLLAKPLTAVQVQALLQEPHVAPA